MRGPLNRGPLLWQLSRVSDKCAGTLRWRTTLCTWSTRPTIAGPRFPTTNPWARMPSTSRRSFRKECSRTSPSSPAPRSSSRPRPRRCSSATPPRRPRLRRYSKTTKYIHRTQHNTNGTHKEHTNK